MVVTHGLFVTSLSLLRGCTDIFCFLLFFVAILVYCAVGILAWTYGDARKVIYPTDSRGEFCGQAGTRNENKPFLFFFNLLECTSPVVLLEFRCPTPQICVKQCPDRFVSLFSIHKEKKINSSSWQNYMQFCKSDFNQSKSMMELLRDQDCPTVLTPSRPFSQRCFPDLETKKGVVLVGNKTSFKLEEGKTINASDLMAAAKAANIVLDVREVAMKIFEDYTRSWHWILIGLLIAMALSLLFVVLLRFIAAVMVCVMILLVMVVLGYGIYHCSMEYIKLRGEAGSDISITDLGLQTDIRVYLHLQQTWLAFLIILCITELLIIVILIFLRKRILIAIALLKEASRAIKHMMCSLLYPLITFVLLLICIAYWTIVAVFLSTSNKAIYKVVSNSSDCNFTCDPTTFNTSNITKQCPGAVCAFAFYGGETNYHKYLTALQLYNVFVFFWVLNFVIALQQCTLAGAFASYYWAYNKPHDIPTFPLFSSLSRTLRYHTGSLAFGSLILLHLIFITIVFIVLGAQNKFAKFLLRCLKCCFWCLEKIIKFLNRNAYIMIAIYGSNFCVSAKNAFFLIMRNILRVAVLDKVTDFLLFLGKMLVVGSVGVLGFFFFTNRIKLFEDKAPQLNYYWVPLMTLLLGSYLIAHGFFSVFAMCVDTLFLCFCEDLERNDGSAERPYYMTPALHDILSIEEPPAPTPPTDIAVNDTSPQIVELQEE
uniref:Choline transporter-like protein n=1 Tax=Callorhinchus milii TaxID=7868 RepID=A0A4W3HNM5_CALMI